MTLPPVSDLHCDTLLELQCGADIANNPEGHIDIPRLRQGDVLGRNFFPAILQRLSERGWSEEKIQILASGYFLRVKRETAVAG